MFVLNHEYSFSIFIPSKTFLLGEYVALTGGPSLLLNTPEYFILNFNKKTKTNSLGSLLSKKSHPATLLLDKYKKKILPSDLKFFNIFVNSCSFEDPYKGSGGFGCSGAEFLSIYFIIKVYKIFYGKKNITKQELKKEWDIFLLQEKKTLNAFNTFKSLTHLGSGFDILSQLFGFITLLKSAEEKTIEHSGPVQCKNLLWPFTNYKFALLKSTKKINTYEHLLGLSSSKLKSVGQYLEPIVKKGVVALQSQSVGDFLSAVSEQQNLLEKESLVSAESIQIVKKILALPKVLASKSCGALGADTFLFFYSKNDEQFIKDTIKTDKELSTLLWMDANYLASGVELQFN